ncbi:MAG: zinc ribbon domain-containing protein [candidate division KSB1 bacterium]|nr:zinc ribbon domain-containing protein [candidate division KSB1 bacterium]MDZ7335922.1 zinc ribbon domain-containing protein [candidate division KSB1 bacterium]MDZ7356783.1 zinc ribbon domain-containing protein [candidate division KSB1 bacterium]MDZ7375019.1 zinc ribbon domain-containing protein [candidate division KSB1 bacterium]MDZ7401258.1 zinc ribbon domain-containing protein [candidate division KSB1 bacterium]
MPTYDYQCEVCGYHFEHFQSITARPLTNCPKCNGQVQRLIGPGNGFLFKGSGFYITDYRSPSYKSEKQKEEGRSFSSESTSSSKTDDAFGSKTMSEKAAKKAE